MERHVAIATDVSALEIVRMTKQAEDLGFAAAWITDIRWLRDCYTVMGALATATDRITLASGYSDVFSRHPGHLAESAATLDELAPGRVIVGLAAGGVALHRLGRSHDRPARTVALAVSALRSLLDGKTVSIESTSFALRDAQLDIHPSGNVRIAIVAHGPLVYEVAGRSADIAILANLTTPEGVTWARSHLTRGRSERDPALGELEELLRVDLCVSSDREAARDVMRRRIARLLSAGYYRNSFVAPPGVAAQLAQDHLPPADLDRLTDALVIAGTPDEVGERLASLIAASGIRAVCCRLFLTADQRPGGAITSLATLLDGVTEASKDDL